MLGQIIQTACNFNPHSHEGSDGRWRGSDKRTLDFNPHSHEGSDNHMYDKERYERLFQSTLPRGERLGCIQNGYRMYTISIHTPTRGATKDNASIPIRDAISIHTPTRGATQVRQDSICRSMAFQSTLPRGERRIAVKSCRRTEKFQSTLPRGERPHITMFNGQFICISIHTPTRGAT